MAHRTKAAAAARDTGIARLVEAERQWRDELAAAERSAAELIAEARRSAEAEDAALERELDQCVVEHRGRIAAELQERIDGIRRDAEQRADRYRTLGDDAVARLAARLLAEVWWPEPASEPEHAGGRR